MFYTEQFHAAAHRFRVGFAHLSQPFDVRVAGARDALLHGAGHENRTRIHSLEGWCLTTRPGPHKGAAANQRCPEDEMPLHPSAGAAWLRCLELRSELLESGVGGRAERGTQALDHRFRCAPGRRKNEKTRGPCGAPGSWWSAGGCLESSPATPGPSSWNLGAQTHWVAHSSSQYGSAGHGNPTWRRTATTSSAQSRARTPAARRSRRAGALLTLLVVLCGS